MTTPDTHPQGGSFTAAGAPAPSDRNSLSVGANGLLLLHDVHFLEQMAHFNREKVPERQPHAMGAGAFGVFEPTEDISRYTKAALFQPGARTDLLIRFSTVAGEMGSPDTWRDVRGFSLKFYTRKGNYDLVGNNTPVFFVRDPMKFPHFIRSRKRLPDSGLRDNHMQWDFWTLNPESAHQVTYLMGDRGAAAQMAGADADFHRRDLFEAIARGEFPTWTLQVQIMPYADAKTYWSSVDPDVGKRIEEKVRAGAATEPVPGMGES
jgi:catalase